MLAIGRKAMEWMRSAVIRQKRRMQVDPALGKAVKQALGNEGWEGIADQHIGVDFRQLPPKSFPVVGAAELDKPDVGVADKPSEQQLALQPPAGIADTETGRPTREAGNDDRADTVSPIEPAGQQRAGVFGDFQDKSSGNRCYLKTDLSNLTFLAIRTGSMAPGPSSFTKLPFRGPVASSLALRNGRYSRSDISPGNPDVRARPPRRRRPAPPR